jgi:hypothetical protein
VGQQTQGGDGIGESVECSAMMRFFGWLLGLLLMLGLLIAAVVGIAQQDRTPTLLQRIGYDLCDERPCFRDVRLGMPVTEASNLLQNKNRTNFPTGWNIDIGEGNLPTVRLISTDDNIVTSIFTITYGESLDIRVGDVMLMYGVPCRIGRMRDGNSNIDQFLLVYPTMSVVVKSAIVQPQFPAPIVTIHPNSRIDNLSIEISSVMGDCVTAPFGFWKGFASSETYLREMENAQ